MKQENLFGTENEKKDSGPVECLGMTFESDEARRTHFTDLLRDKLKDPEFRAIEGFPIGTDEAILDLSDPPYYTACPNPWLNDFIALWESRKINHEINYHREPFAADVSEGKGDPIYNAHSYHTKVPHKAIMRYFLHYTQPGDVVLDGFSGSGMAGIAAQMCANKKEVIELGYTVDQDNVTILENGQEISKLGERHCILNDLSPAANNIAYGNNQDVDAQEFYDLSQTILSTVENEFSWMFKTLDPETGDIVDAKYYVWSEVLQCNSCGEELVFADNALSEDYKKVSDEFECTACSSKVNKKALAPVYENIYDSYSNSVIERPKRVVSLVCFSRKRRNILKKPDDYDLEVIRKSQGLDKPKNFPSNKIPDMQMMRVGRMKPSKITQMNHFYCDKTIHVLARLWELCNGVSDFKMREMLCYWLDSHFVNLSLRNRFRPGVSFPYNPMAGVFYLPMMCSEANPFVAYKNKSDRIVKALNSIDKKNSDVLISCGSASSLGVMDNSIDYIFTDPPFGENIYYSDLNFFIESWRQVFTNTEPEAIIDRVKSKDLVSYMKLMSESFKEYYRVLKPGRWITVEFSNTKSAVWNGIQTALSGAGFIVSNVSMLDKVTNTFQAVNSATAVKQDLVISAYKPSDDFSNKFKRDTDEEGIWDFVSNHLNYLPIVKVDGDEIVPISERDPRILFDQVVAYFIRNHRDVPMSSRDFQLGLQEKFVEREGMFFTQEQVATFDKKRALSSKVKQLTVFVDDEASAIEWLRLELQSKPKTYSDIHPLFLNELSGWKKNELELELSTLLEQNFIKYDGKDEVPSQIHTYLSTNFKDMRGLDKSDPKLVAKAKDRWYVPDPNKAADLEKVRLRALLKEFETYKESKKKIKQPRAEALRAGFNTAWEAQDFQTILDISAKIPPAVLQEDEKLLMFYDNALTLTSTEDDEW
ncbi:DNA methyltransferase [Vibrio parahaemolyticus]|uniref:DNA methyltransferase n=1 Tax=Vibrio parahaemolyticus TaxID=670 RepID=UPI00084B8A52|nr:DNA methyltransferase [Vibrio parahaemolyticus]EGQ9693548.1 site-specific DNA-methyltransferase [Vibrio parahaemolyticus]EGR1958862.1 DNA methylase [Vibrio parahaemolyticus]EGR1968043.1 DNA methylase [Vibrio parahaemolyticus]EHR6711680.1 DNA methylase [Vibrio parahaemolyticus]ELA9299474.1 DNA methylase [Vibrio parahaemolyticus]